MRAMRRSGRFAAFLPLILIWIPPVAAEAQSCVSACAAAARFCAKRCTEVTSESLSTCEIACARPYFVDCFTRCVETGEASMPDPFEEEREPAGEAEGAEGC